MSLKPQTIQPIPEETVRVARAAFPASTIYTDEQFVDLYPQHGQPALAPWRLARVTVMQFAETLIARPPMPCELGLT